MPEYGEEADKMVDDQEEKHLLLDDIQLGEKLGQGGQAAVYHGNKDGQNWAFKVYEKSIDDLRAIEAIYKEYEIFTALKHQHLIKL